MCHYHPGDHRCAEGPKEPENKRRQKYFNGQFIPEIQGYFTLVWRYMPIILAHNSSILAGSRRARVQGQPGLYESLFSLLPP